MVSIDFGIADEVDMQDEDDPAISFFKVVTTGGIIKCAQRSEM